MSPVQWCMTLLIPLLKAEAVKIFPPHSETLPQKQTNKKACFNPSRREAEAHRSLSSSLVYGEGSGAHFFKILLLFTPGAQGSTLLNRSTF